MIKKKIAMFIIIKGERIKFSLITIFVKSHNKKNVSTEKLNKNLDSNEKKFKKILTDLKFTEINV